MNVHKFIYIMVHLVTPLTFFTVSVVWGNTVLEKNIWVNLSDNLSIMGIYYVLVGVFWIINMKTLDKVSKEIYNKKL